VNKLSLKAKFLSVIIAILFLLVVVGTAGYFSLKTVSEYYNHVASINLPNLDKLSEMKVSVLFIRSNVNRLAYNFNDVELRNTLLKNTTERIEDYEKLAAEYAAIPFVPGEEELATPVDKKWTDLKPLILRIAETSKTVTSENSQLFLSEIKDFIPRTQEFFEAMDHLMDFQAKESKRWSHEAEASATRSLYISILLMAFATIFGLVIGYILTTKLSQQLARITEHVGNASTQVSAASAQLNTAADQLSSVSQQQASSLEETSAALTEITGMAESNIKGAETADKTAKEVYEISETTRKSMDELTTAMTSILESNTRIEKLVKVIEEIGEKTEVIDDIVFKTQLLSFNASVEAERAGEHGRGFAVVAQEVGNLAQLSGKAALEISSIVKTSIKEAESVASENKSRVESGGELARNTKDKMEIVLQKLTGILDGVSKIVDASKEQGQGIGQISTSVESISHMTQETAGTAEESASASAELSGQALSLGDLVKELRTIVSGRSDSAPPASSASHTQDLRAEAPAKTEKVVLFKNKLKAAKSTNSSNVSESGSRLVANGSAVAHGSNEAWEKL
jgi:methyl-accepting chemotaxis protein